MLPRPPGSERAVVASLRAAVHCRLVELDCQNYTCVTVNVGRMWHHSGAEFSFWAFLIPALPPPLSLRASWNNSSSVVSLPHHHWMNRKMPVHLQSEGDSQVDSVTSLPVGMDFCFCCLVFFFHVLFPSWSVLGSENSAPHWQLLLLCDVILAVWSILKCEE